MADLIDFVPGGKYFKLVAITPIICLVIYFNLFGRNSLHKAYLDYQINTRIVIVGHEHDYPLIRRKIDSINYRPFGLYAPGACRRYVIDNDSVVKVRGSSKIEVVRDSLEYRVTTVWAEYDDTSPLTPIERRVVKRAVLN